MFHICYFGDIEIYRRKFISNPFIIRKITFTLLIQSFVCTTTTTTAKHCYCYCIRCRIQKITQDGCLTICMLWKNPYCTRVMSHVLSETATGLMKHGADYKLRCQGKSCLSSGQQYPHKIFLLIFSFIWTLPGRFTIQYCVLTLLWFSSLCCRCSKFSSIYGDNNNSCT